MSGIKFNYAMILQELFYDTIYHTVKGKMKTLNDVISF